ncbi:KpsF/GutQ family sugar-phosphate isomerase [Pseudactinotalea sp. Z1739]|uniref:KpsF/GutQ family sugar-phosphate isomerase n=1 Tax=Pseudactinotalea sp. Z1739 TaxID=3413028 RepID=UPI003C7B43E1
MPNQLPGHPAGMAAAMTGLRAELVAARESLQVEVEALRRSIDTVLPALGAALDLIRSRPGKVVVSGLGKSGLIGVKIAATLASTGTPAHFMHASDALHGDSGSVAAGDIGILISNSGTTAEVCQVARMLASWDVPVIAMTAEPASPLAESAQVWLDISVPRESDPLGLAPTSSALVTLAVGDALAAALMTRSGFDAGAFGERHPGGALGHSTRRTADAGGRR